MAVKGLTNDEVNALTVNGGTRNAQTGVKFFPLKYVDYHYQVQENFWLLGHQVPGGAVVKDDTSATHVYVTPCRVRLNGKTLVWGGGVADLAAYNNDTAYIYLQNDGADAGEVIAVADGTGWPATPHIRLAEVPVAAGAIDKDTMVQRWREHGLVAGIDLPRYKIEIETQGDTGSPSTIKITAQDVGGNAIAAVDYLRVRICDSAGYADATNATIAAGSNTTVAETHSATKDITFKSHTDGTWRIDLTDGTAETVTLRIGPAPLSARRADFSNTLNVTHAAP